MASVGELFKFLGANDIFQSLCQDSEKTTQQIISIVFENEELITSLRNIVQDDNIIKSKMDILIGQKRKNQNKKQEQVTKLTLASVADINDQEQIQEFKYSPNDPSKVIYLDNFAFIEQVDYRMRLVTHNYELYY